MGEYQKVVEAINAITYSAPATVTIGTLSATIIVANANRRYLCIVNASANRVSLSLSGDNAVLNSGITLGPLGHFEMTVNAGNITTGIIKGIAGAAGTIIAVQEGI